MIPLRTKSRQDYETPDWFFRWLLSRWPLTLDAAASPHNTKLPRYYTRRDNGLLQAWDKYTFCNPPFKKIRPWVEKALSEALEGNTSVLLLPNSVTARWYRDNYRQCATELLYPRLPYKNAPKAVPFGSMLMIFTPYYANNPDTRIDLVDMDRLIKGSYTDVSSPYPSAMFRRDRLIISR